MIKILGLALVELAKIRGPQQFGEPDDVGQRRAQFIGHMLDEFVLEHIGLAQCLVFLGQHAFGADAVSDIDESDHGLAVGQRHDGIIKNEPGGKFDAAFTGAALILETGNRPGEQFPAVSLAMRRLARFGDEPDMRARLDLLFGETPERPE